MLKISRSNNSLPLAIIIGSAFLCFSSLPTNAAPNYAPGCGKKGGDTVCQALNNNGIRGAAQGALPGLINNNAAETITGLLATGGALGAASELGAQFLEEDGSLSELGAQLFEQDGTLSALGAQFIEGDGTLSALGAQLIEEDGTLSALGADVFGSDNLLGDIAESLSNRAVGDDLSRFAYDLGLDNVNGLLGEIGGTLEDAGVDFEALGVSTEFQDILENAAYGQISIEDVLTQDNLPIIRDGLDILKETGALGDNEFILEYADQIAGGIDNFNALTGGLEGTTGSSILDDLGVSVFNPDSTDILSGGDFFEAISGNSLGDTLLGLQAPLENAGIQFPDGLDLVTGQNPFSLDNLGDALDTIDDLRRSPLIPDELSGQIRDIVRQGEAALDLGGTIQDIAGSTTGMPDIFGTTGSSVLDDLGINVFNPDSTLSLGGNDFFEAVSGNPFADQLLGLQAPIENAGINFPNDILSASESDTFSLGNLGEALDVIDDLRRNPLVPDDLSRQIRDVVRQGEAALDLGAVIQDTAGSTIGTPDILTITGVDVSGGLDFTNNPAPAFSIDSIGDALDTIDDLRRSPLVPDTLSRQIRDVVRQGEAAIDFGETIQNTAGTIPGTSQISGDGLFEAVSGSSLSDSLRGLQAPLENAGINFPDNLSIPESTNTFSVDDLGDALDTIDNLRRNPLVPDTLSRQIRDVVRQGEAALDLGAVIRDTVGNVPQTSDVLTASSRIVQNAAQTIPGTGTAQNALSGFVFENGQQEITLEEAIPGTGQSLRFDLRLQ